MSDKIDVVIKVQDESGKPIPYVTVWQYIKPNSEHIKRPEAQMTMTDLWRVATRYEMSHDFVLDYGEKPINNFFITEMSDANGRVKHVLDYQDFTGSGNKYPRPEPTNFGYTFIKQGYFPEKVEFNIATNKSHADAVVILKRDPNEEIESAPYIQTYERLRYELSDERKNEEMSTANQQRILRIENELEQAAQQAIAAGDNKAAARIYIRMRYLPTITLQDGITGYSHVNRESPRSKRVWELAKQLEPDNLFIWIHTISDRNRTGNTDDMPKVERISNLAKQTELLIEKHGLAVWPVIYDLRAGVYANIDQKDKSKKLFLEAAELEPKYKDWSKELK